ncbi:CgeB family protein [Salidesulfovibrio brasiliensis]|uniref:CgeB family protein n=1 Tax=Salidesulfovibrio brasiliensis TaxID=221711 RepID=UPI0009F87430|nr:glycosyltransferase [Salidesulfovibrio brasiliensis]
MPKLEKLRRVRFRGSDRRVLFFETGYFLNREIQNTAKALGWELQCFPLLDEYDDPDKFLPALLAAVDRFRPDFILTVNHFGVDRAGGLLRLCKRIALPLATWFVDDPLLTLPFFDEAQNPWLTVFSYDRDCVKPLKTNGYANVFPLPLGTDTSVFNENVGFDDRLECDVSFVGDSKQAFVQERLEYGQFPKALLDAWEELAGAYLEEKASDPVGFITHKRPDLSMDIGLIGHDRRVWFAQLVRAEATRRHRERCVQSMLPLRPTLVGRDWPEIVGSASGARFIEALSYYEHLPTFYRSCTVNLNITGTGAGVPNQRIFDVPAVGGFVLTDNVPQLSRYYDIGDEVAVYESHDEIAEAIRRWQRNPKERREMIEKAMRRTLAEHTYQHRLQRMGDILSRLYS